MVLILRLKGRTVLLHDALIGKKTTIACVIHSCASLAHGSKALCGPSEFVRYNEMRRVSDTRGCQGVSVLGSSCNSNMTVDVVIVGAGPAGISRRCRF